MIHFREIDKIVTKTDRKKHITAIVSGLDVHGYARYAEYRTGKDRRGLWEWDPMRHDWKQIVGVADFEELKPADFRDKLRAMLLAK